MMNEKERVYIIRQAYQRGMNAGFLLAIALVGFAIVLHSITSFFVSL
jgi:hypothetical protein